MNFYSLTLDINDRREHHLELFPQGQSHRLQKPKSFVIDLPGFSLVRIVSILMNSEAKCFVLNGSDIPLASCEAKVSRDGERIIIHFQKGAKAPEPEAKPRASTQKDISFEDIEALSEYNKPKEKAQIQQQAPVPDKRLDLGYVAPHLQVHFSQSAHSFKLEGLLPQGIRDDAHEDAQLEVVYQLEVEGQIYENSILITLSHPANFLGMALDFGSESSQMAIKRYESTHPYHPQTADNENLFRNIVAYHKNQEWIPRDSAYDFYQEEKGTNFYKSLFFLREQLSGNYRSVDSEPFILEPQENLKMLLNIEDGFTTLEGEKFYQLPNLKILHKHERLLEDFVFEISKEGYPIPLKLRDLKQKVYNTILEVMIVSFLKKEFIRYDNAKRNIRMMLLIPNNYDIKDINKTQHHLNIIFDALAKSDEYKGKIGAWEILTISESDASFIGYINKNNVDIYNNKDYIIIDSGKGTTDFSVIRTGEKNLYNLKPIYRNGFTGAGNMITYAVFETVMHFIREHNPEHGADVLFLKEKVVDVLKGNDLASRNKFYNQIERLKFNYRDQSQEQTLRKAWLEARDEQVSFSNIVAGNYEIDALVNLLSKVNGITDFYGYIAEACHFIVNNVVSYLRIIKDNKEDLALTGVVLTGRAFRFQMLADLMRDKLHASLGIPKDKISLLGGNELKDICIKGVFNNSIKLNAEVTGYPIQLVYRSQQDLPETNRNKQVKAPLSKRIFNFFINDLADMDRVEEVHSIDDKVDYNLLQRSQFLIGCKRYAIRNDEFLSAKSGNQYTASIDFTQRGFVMRRKVDDKVDYVSVLEEIDEGGSGDKSLIVPSLFPNYMDVEFIQSLNVAVEKQQVVSGHRNTPPDDYYPPYYAPDERSSKKNNDDNPLFF